MSVAAMDRADSIDVGDRGPRRLHSQADAAMRLLGLGIETADIVEQLEGQVVAHLLGRGLEA